MPLIVLFLLFLIKTDGFEVDQTKREQARMDKFHWLDDHLLFWEYGQQTEDTLLTKNIQNAKYFEFLPKWLVVSVALLTAEYLWPLRIYEWKDPMTWMISWVVYMFHLLTRTPLTLGMIHGMNK